MSSVPVIAIVTQKAVPVDHNGWLSVTGINERGKTQGGRERMIRNGVR